MNQAPLKIGLLGLGRAGKFHLQSLRLIDEARLVRVCDVDQDRCAEVSQREGCASDETAEQLIAASDVEAVIIATPTDSHTQYVQLALEVGKPVLTEKPLGRELREIDACFNRAESSGTPLFVAFQRRFDPAFSDLVRAVRAGDVGQLQFVRSVSRDNPVPSPEYISTSGGIFHDCLVHDLDMVCHIVGEVPTHVSSFSSSFVPEIGNLGDVDNVASMLAFPSGAVATIDINRKSVYGYDQRVEVFGSNGMLQVDNYHNTSLSHASATGFAKPPVDYSFPTRYRDAYRLELECFVRCARREQSVPITHHDVRVNHLLASAMARAAETREVIAFSTDQ